MLDNSMDLNKILSLIDNKDLLEKLNSLGLMLGNPEKGEQINELVSNLLEKKNEEVDNLSKSMLHTDHRLNLLLALKPYLSEKKKCRLDMCVKSMNMIFTIQQLGKR